MRFILQSKQGKLRFLLLHIEETAFYQLLKPLYQFQNFRNLMKKTKGKKSLPTKRQSPPQPRINPAFRQKVRKADGNVSPIASFIPEPLIDAGNPHKIRGSGEFNKQGSVVGHGFHDFPYMVNNVGSQI